MMMVVELIESIPPRKTASIVSHPRAVPVIKPMTNIPRQLMPAVMKAALPTLSNFLKLNSSPNPNRRKMMPMSDH